MNVYQKLQIARLSLLEKELKKSGRNHFAKFDYFELQDFLPTVQTIFGDTGLSAVFRCNHDMASLTVYNNDKPEEFIEFTAPMASAELKGNHQIQNLGASISYLRRYLYINALEIVEHDVLDATSGSDAPKKAEAKTESKSEAKPVETDGGKTSEGMAIKIDPAHQLFVDSMIDWAKSSTSLSELTSLWKENQKMIDEVKKFNKEQFKRLQDSFAGFKENFKEESNG